MIATITPTQQNQGNLIAQALNGQTSSLAQALNAAIQRSQQDVNIFAQQNSELIQEQSRNLNLEQQERFDLRNRVENLIRLDETARNNQVTRATQLADLELRQKRFANEDEAFGFERQDRKELRDAGLSTAQQATIKNEREGQRLASGLLNDQVSRFATASNAQVARTNAATNQTNASTNRTSVEARTAQIKQDQENERVERERKALEDVTVNEILRSLPENATPEQKRNALEEARVNPNISSDRVADVEDRLFGNTSGTRERTLTVAQRKEIAVSQAKKKALEDRLEALRAIPPEDREDKDNEEINDINNKIDVLEATLNALQAGIDGLLPPPLEDDSFTIPSGGASGTIPAAAGA